MDGLNYDIIYKISYYLNFDSILNLSIVNKNYNIIFDDNYYQNLVFLYYTKKFWEIASKRPIKLSKPLKNFKKEIIRIEKFQKTLDNLNLSRWNNNDFYCYWKSQEKLL